MIQGLFVHLMQAKVLAYLDPQRGRFRSFLLAALKQYLAQERRRGQTAAGERNQRGGTSGVAAGDRRCELVGGGFFRCRVGPFDNA